MFTAAAGGLLYRGSCNSQRCSRLCHSVTALSAAALTVCASSTLEIPTLTASAAPCCAPPSPVGNALGSAALNSLLLKKEHIAKTEEFYAKYGGKTGGEGRRTRKGRRVRGRGRETGRRKSGRGRVRCLLDTASNTVFSTLNCELSGGHAVEW